MYIDPEVVKAAEVHETTEAEKEAADHLMAAAAAREEARRVGLVKDNQ